MRERRSKRESVMRILDGFQDLIMQGESAAAAQEYYAPMSDSDRSDDIIRHGREQVKALRELRHKFENLMLGVDFE